MKDFDAQNSVFWSEPCGTQAANDFGLNLNDSQDLAQFDQWFWSFYPYLKEMVDVTIDNAKSVLEIGVGSGTLSRYLNTKRIDLNLLDVSLGALQYVRQTINNTSVTYLHQSILNIENLNKKYDCVLAIGSLHHTGDLGLALKNAESLVKPDGKILVMVYYAWQPRRILMHPFRSLREYLSTLSFSPNRSFIFQEQDGNVRKSSDVNSRGEAAPSTAYASRKFFKKRKAVIYSATLRNSHRIGFKRITLLPRLTTLKYVSPIFGCDIYATGTLSQIQQ